MNAHDQNSIYRTFKAMLEQPAEFTRKLSHDEQRALSPDARHRYWDWLFAGNAGMTARWERRERQEQTSLDIDRTHDRMASGAEDYTSNPKQAST